MMTMTKNQADFEALMAYTEAYREEYEFVARWGVTEILLDDVDQNDKVYPFSSFDDFCPLLDEDIYNRRPVVILPYYWPNYGCRFPTTLPTHKEPVEPIKVPIIGNRWHDLYKSADAAVRISGD